MRKTLVIALREYNAAVRTKAFVLGLVMMPTLMGGSLIVQRLAGNQRDTKERTIAVVDRTPGAVLKGRLIEAVGRYNEHLTDPRTGEVVRPRIVLEDVPAPEDSPGAMKGVTDRLSARARRGALAGWLEIGPDVAELPSAAPRTPSEKPPPRATVIYETVKPPDQKFIDWVQGVLGERVRELRAAKLNVSPQAAEVLSRPMAFETKREHFEAAIFVPILLMMLMFMLILMTATPLLQGVVEEKMQRIAEVLLGSVSPFQLMLGKLVGMTAVGLTIAAVYLGGAYWAARHYEMTEYAPPGLLAWFIVFQTLASLMFGALFIAIGAACTDMREAQNLLWPVMLLATMPMFLLAQVIRDPGGGLVVGASFFPFATPNLMIARLAMPPGIPWWQPALGAMGMLATTLVCVWAAGRIFRVGILMMGKGASPAEMVRWVFRG
jgi:ABC-2 type transport system permease protein